MFHGSLFHTTQAPFTFVQDTVASPEVFFSIFTMTVSPSLFSTFPVGLRLRSRSEKIRENKYYDNELVCLHQLVQLQNVHSLIWMNFPLTFEYSLIRNSLQVLRWHLELQFCQFLFEAHSLLSSATDEFFSSWRWDAYYQHTQDQIFRKLAGWWSRLLKHYLSCAL